MFPLEFGRPFFEKVIQVFLTSEKCFSETFRSSDGSIHPTFTVPLKSGKILTDNSRMLLSMPRRYNISLRAHVMKMSSNMFW